MKTMKREMEDIKKSPSLQSLGKRIYLLCFEVCWNLCWRMHTCHQHSQQIWERGRAGLCVELLTCAGLGPRQMSRINSEGKLWILHVPLSLGLHGMSDNFCD